MRNQRCAGSSARLISNICEPFPAGYRDRPSAVDPSSRFVIIGVAIFEGGKTMEYLAIAFGLVALFMAWRNGRAAKAVQDRLDSVNNRYFTLVNQVRESEEATQRELMDLRVEIKRQAGLLKFEPQMTIAEIYAMHPRAAEVLAG